LLGVTAATCAAAFGFQAASEHGPTPGSQLICDDRRQR
jgi:hypothetical protein